MVCGTKTKWNIYKTYVYQVSLINKCWFMWMALETIHIISYRLFNIATTQQPTQNNGCDSPTKAATFRNEQT